MNNRCEFIRYHLFSHEQLQGFPLAGKSGTSSDFRDAWLVGYTPELVTGVWVGYDDHRPLGEKETGGRTALPLWLAFMREASRDSETGDFPVPTGIEWSVVNLEGQRVSAAAF